MGVGVGSGVGVGVGVRVSAGSSGVVDEGVGSGVAGVPHAIASIRITETETAIRSIRISPPFT